MLPVSRVVHFSNTKIYTYLVLLPPANVVCEGYVFTSVCLSTGSGIPACLVGHMTRQQMCLSWCGGSMQVTSNAWWDRSNGTPNNPPPRQTPPSLGRHPLEGTHWQARLWAGTPPGRYTPQAGTPIPGRYTPSLHSACWDTVNKRAVRIPLECILVFVLILAHLISNMADASRFQRRALL